MKRLAIVTTHPIQYNAPWFCLLAQRNKIEIEVFYTWSQSEKGSNYDHGFGKHIQWDIPLLEGYNYTFVKNISSDPGVHHFKGIKNPSLINEIEQYKPDAILVIGWSFQSHLACLRHFSKKLPLLFRGDSTLLNAQSPLKKIVRTAFLKWVYHYITTAFYVGKRNKEYFLACGLKEKQLVFTPHAIENERFSDASKNYKEEAIACRGRLNIKNEDIVFLFAGKLESKKDPGILIDAFKNIQLADVHLIIAGNGILEKELKTKYSTTPNLHFIDFQNQLMMPVLYNVCDVFVLPSKGPDETWGLAVNEAMACGKAIIVSDKCGCAGDLVKENNGFIFKSKNVEDLENKMKLMISNKSNLKSMGHYSSQIIQDWSFINICIPVENSVNNLIGHNANQ